MVWRYVLAFVLSMLVIIFWQALNPPPPARPPIHQQAPVAPAPPAAGQPPAAGGPAPLRGDAEVVKAQRPARPPREILVKEGARFAYLGEARGGGLSAVYLPEDHESIEKKGEPYQLLLSSPSGPGTFGLEIEGQPIPWDENWELAEDALENGSKALIFTNEVGGWRVTKTVTPDPLERFPPPPGAEGARAGPRHLELRLEIQNAGLEERQVAYFLYGPAGVDSEALQGEGTDIELVHGSWGRGDAVHAETLPAAKLTGGHWERGERLAWVGVSNNYFTSILFPLTPAGQRSDVIERAFADSYPDRQHIVQLAKEKHQRPPEQLSPQELSSLEASAFKNLRAGFKSLRIALKPGEALTHEYALYLGPRDREVLDRYAALNFQGVNHYGMFGILVKFFIWLLGLLKMLAFGSWGIAIILLTVLVKTCLHPINKRSQAGMMRFQKKMQKVKPQMDEIKERYGQNRMKLNQEMQKLWKANDINPAQQMAGCLIIFLQLPIWWGLYNTLQYALGLRQAGFLYIQDLTRADALFSFGTTLPFLGSTFNLLPFLYVILTVLQQRLQPKPDDPQMLAQYRMMTFMLIFFGFIFYKFPAGFMLYIMTSSGLGILESKIIKAEIARDEARESAAAGASPKEGPRQQPAPLYPARPPRSEEGAGRQQRKGRR